ncbi:MAG: histidine phosphatase family protein, partial [Marinovum sp.]|nr:histidine phosphatase family protein [Marinovum sp.]
MTDFPEVYFLRHGQTEWNLQGRFQGQKDSPLTALGRVQAEDQGRLLRALIADWRAVDVWVSPLGRTRKTAEIALRNVPAMPEIVPELAEINVGGWQGLRRAEIEKLEPRLATGSQSERFE